MTKTAYVQQSYYFNSSPFGPRKWYSDNCAAAAFGLKKLGYNVIGFLPEELNSLPLTKKTPVKATVGLVRHALTLIGAPQPPNVDIPDSLKKFANRKIWTTTMGVIRRKNQEVFIKPLHQQKAFCGHVFRPIRKLSAWDNYYHETSQTKEFPNSYPVLAQEVVDWDGEHRVYVLDKKVIGVAYYDEFKNKPMSKAFIENVVKTYKEQPRAFVVDVGCIDRSEDVGRTKLIPSVIEVNEGFSAGLFEGAITKVNYARMFEARWKEMVAA